MSDPTPAAAAPSPPPPPTTPKGKLVPILLIVNSALMAGVLGVMLLKPFGGGAAAKGSEGSHEKKKAEHGEEHGGGEHAEEPSDEHGKGTPGVGPTLKMADLVVHLRNPETERYARLAVELEIVSEVDKEKVTLYLPRLRDAFIAYFTDRTMEELTGSEALARTKQELFKKVEELVPSKRVRALYITDFVVQ